MNEELKKKMSEYLVVLEQDLKSVKDFSVEQVPLVVQEYINWIFWSNCFGAILALIAMIIAAIIWRKIYKTVDGDTDDQVFTLIMGSLVMVAFSIPMCVHFAKAAKAHIAPRVVIIEKISELVKETK